MPLGLVSKKPSTFDAEERIVLLRELVIEPQEAQPVVIVADEIAGRERRRDGRGLRFVAVFAGEEEVRLSPSYERAAESEAAVLPERVVGESLPLVALPVVEAGERRLGAWRAARAPAPRRDSWSPPLCVTMLTTLPVLPPYSAEKPLVSTVISSTAIRGMLVKIV